MLTLKPIDLKKEKAESIVIPVCEDNNIHTEKTIISLVKKAKTIKPFKGRKDDELILYHLEDVGAPCVIFLGIGKAAEADAEVWRVFASKAVKMGIKKELTSASVVAPSAKKTGMEKDRLIVSIAEGAMLGNHRFDLYKKKKKLKPLKKICLLTASNVTAELEKQTARIAIICDGAILAREWVSMPPNDKRPAQFAKLIVKQAQKENLNITVLKEKELKQKKCGAILAVAAGSQSKPRMIVLSYEPKNAKKTVALIGKGVTFDSGGINLKPAGSLDTMKMDMAGGAAVAATMITLARIKSDVKTVGIIPIVENMPSGHASRPGDIIKTYSGKTVEIGNTDAEGRLILADAMAYAIDQFKPDLMIDLATLTGACVAALGEKIAGVFSSDKKLNDAIITSGERTFERCWPLPLPKDYQKLLKSEFADIKNLSSSRWGGAITAALFLSEFVKDTPWAHIDIAGPAYITKIDEYCGVGGTGFGVRLLCDLLPNL
jgi:leucyl aminopeptidase